MARPAEHDFVGRGWIDEQEIPCLTPEFGDGADQAKDQQITHRAPQQR